MGTFIAIEGGDGSGKGTQTKLLVEYLRSIGKDVLQLSFPRYGEDSAYYIERYLNGEYGSAEDVPAELGTLPYALDRFAAKSNIEHQLSKANGIVISDRYMASNLAHQGTKVADTNIRHSFYNRTLKTEYDILGIPRPNLNIVLLVPAIVSQENVDKKEERSYTKQKRDIHEADSSHLEKAKLNYEELTHLYPNEFTSIICTDANNKMRSIETIQSEIITLIYTAIN